MSRRGLGFGLLAALAAGLVGVRGGIGADPPQATTAVKAVQAEVGDPAVVRTREQVKMLDDLFKVAVVDITNRYDGPPAAKVAKAIFQHAEKKDYFRARLVDATGAPLNEANLPADPFETRAAEAMNAGTAYLEEVVGTGDSRRLRVATLVPAVVEKCAKCHGTKTGAVLGFLSYDVPIR